jgi:8-oxo-dGTP diphosphatase
MGEGSKQHPGAVFPEPPMFALGTAVFGQRDGKILLLKRAVGALTGSWYLPGGALDPGETLEECAVRELREESGLVPTGPLALIGHAPMHIYDRDFLIVSYACDCTGAVVLSHEHSDARWIEPEKYRDEFFSEENIRKLETTKARVGAIVRGIQKNIDQYLVWRKRERELHRLRSADS